VAPPPIALEMRDLRTGYEVTTPDRMWLAFNWLYHSGTAAERFDALPRPGRGGARRADRPVLGGQARPMPAGRAPVADAAAPRVLTLAELRAAALADPQRAGRFRGAGSGACTTPTTRWRCRARSPTG
jgi:arginine utilization protein RocB